MTSSYKELLAQREALEQAIAKARQNEISSAVAKVRELVAEYGLSAQDIFPGRAAKSSGAGMVKLKRPERSESSACTSRKLAPGICPAS